MRPHLLLGALTALSTLAVVPASAHAAEDARGRASVAIPESVQAEHKEIHDALVAATTLPGGLGEAARELAQVLHPHFVREEEIALPPLGMLAPLASGIVPLGADAVLAMTDQLRKELPQMLAEHVRIRAAVARLADVAGTQGNAEVGRLAQALAMHARTEEEVLYPAAILVGDIIRARQAGQ